MRTRSLALATVLAAAALSVQAGPRMETTGPFTYEAVGATPVISFGRAATRAAKAPSVAPKATVTGMEQPAAPARASATSTFTYDAVGATPHVTVRKQPARDEAKAPAAAH
jgi:hypothetical protein